MPGNIWLRGGQLERAKEWFDRGLTENWARQYGGDYEQTAAFIQLSVKQREWEQRRAWIVAGASVLALVIIAVLAVLAFKARRDTDWANKKLETANIELKQNADEKVRINKDLNDTVTTIRDTNTTLQDTLKREKEARTETVRQRIIGIWQSAARQAIWDATYHIDDDRTALPARQAMLFNGRIPGNVDT